MALERSRHNALVILLAERAVPDGAIVERDGREMRTLERALCDLAAVDSGVDVHFAVLALMNALVQPTDTRAEYDRGLYEKAVAAHELVEYLAYAPVKLDICRIVYGQHEVIVRHARENLVVIKMIGDGLVEAFQHAVALLIAEAVVDILELVDIEQRDSPALRVGALEQLLGILEILRPASAAGERIYISHPA